MVKFTKEERKNMMEIVEKQKAKIDELGKKKAELQKELKKLIDKIGEEDYQREIICELYGIHYDYEEHRYVLDPEP